jgi:soluble cytochrome b562
MKYNASSNIIRVIKSRRIKWVEHAVRMEDMRNGYKILVLKLDEVTRKT